MANRHVFDKAFIDKVVCDSNHQLAELIVLVGKDIRQEMRDQSLISAVQELQANIMVLGRLLDLANISASGPQIAVQLIPHALIPLQTNLEKTRMRLEQFGKDDLGSYCQIVGLSTLIAGYSCLGQEMPALRNELEKSALKFQSHLLDEIAQMRIQAKERIPWDRVSHLISMDGVDDLETLYSSTKETVQQGTSFDASSDGTGSRGKDQGVVAVSLTPKYAE